MELIIITKNSNNISVLRVARWTLACLIVFTAVAFVFGVGIASAESGSITVVDDRVTVSGVSSQQNTAGMVWTQLNFDITSFTTLEEVIVTPIIGTTTISFPYASFESTRFTCTAGCVGGGWFYYQNGTINTVKYVFDSDTTFSAGLLTLTFNKQIYNNISVGSSWLLQSGIVSASKPACVYHTATLGGAHCTNFNYSTHTTSEVTDAYNLTYFENNFVLNVTKGKNINTRWGVFDAAYDLYAYDDIGGVPYNKADFQMIKDYNGVIVNVSIVAGGYTTRVINVTGTGYVPPDLPPDIDPITGVGIKFDRESYNVGDIANISWIRTDSTPISLQDFVILVEPDGTKLELVSSPADTGFTKILMSELGTYSVIFKRCSFFCLSSYTLVSDTALVNIDEQPSYIYAPPQVGVGQLFNVTYLIGWTKTTGSTVWLRDYSWDTTTNAYSTTYQPSALIGAKGVETNYSVLVTKTGKHLLKICDVLLGCKASTIVEAYFNGSEVTTNVSKSNITIDKTSYSYGETMLVKVGVDNYNWSDKQIVVEYEDYDEGIIQNQYYVQHQIQSIPLYISDLTFSGSGASRLILTGKNDTGNYILAYVNFSLSNVDSEGYGLSVMGDTNCIKDTVQVNVIVPAGETGNLIISADEVKYNKYYSINGTKIISYKYQIDGTYYFTLNVNGEAKRVIIKFVSSTEICAIITPVPTYIGVNGTWASTQENIASTCNFWDGWVRTCFGAQGVNDVTRLQLALLVIGAMMFIGMIASKGNFGVAVALGFLPYAFFAYLSMSTPCGQYMPLWVSIFIALIIGIKMRWFS